jgi:hypothetical protein
MGRAHPFFRRLEQELHAAKSRIAAKGATEIRFRLRFDMANIAVHSLVAKSCVQCIANKAECKNDSAFSKSQSRKIMKK